MTQTDRFQVETVLSRLGRLVDDRDWSGLPELFTDIVEVDYTSLWGGEPEKLARETLIERWRTSLSGLDATQHVITNVLAGISGDTATVTANVIATHRLVNPVGGPLWTVGGTYHVRLARTGGRWAIEALMLKVAWTDGNADIMTRAAAEGAA